MLKFNKNRSWIREKYLGVNFARGYVLISILSGLSYVKDGNVDEAVNSFFTAIIIFFGLTAYLLRKRRFFNKSIKGSIIYEWVLLAPLILYFLWYMSVHGDDWYNDPYPLLIVSTVWSLVAYMFLCILCKNENHQKI